MNKPRWTRRPERSNWGDFGADDELGRLNLIDHNAVLRGVREVKEGRSFCLSLPLDYPGGNVLSPRRHPPKLCPTFRDDKPVYNLPLDESGLTHTDVLSDDAVLLHTQYSTQWDSFAHVGKLYDATGTGAPKPIYYNGYRGGDDIVGPSESNGRPIGAQRLGIETMAVKAIQTRGVLVNLFSRFGRDRKLVNYDDLMRIIDEDQISIESGDILCLYTGFADMVMQMKGKPDPQLLASSHSVLDGRCTSLQNWIVDSNIAAIAADNYAVEALPPAPAVAAPCARLPLHELCLFGYGIPLGELWLLGELASALEKSKRHGFLLTAPPLRLTGAVGSPVTPVATL
ncbi:cyclase family protein [Allopusillimonas soli]|uniref:Cyclase family protein n=1 Tax=Allopusillimonas soli TaxID=659016 RepID=A0A853F749_9BURK|nr:cyclase family protein [Allopusillimonas soli]NYT35923.1 cyclase family protein [Allopusillimonas soli]TEA76279.1 cyclase family protein [Allopusillimonas soli]